MDFLRRHPFPVVAHFSRVVAVSFAFPEAVLRPLVPAGLEIDSFAGLGFVTVALVWTKNLRPAGLPSWLGQDFLLAGYRIFTRLRDAATGRNLRGLQILRSETDRWQMVWMGNLVTHYHYRKVQAVISENDVATRVQTSTPQGRITLDLTFATPGGSVDLPLGSPFRDWHQARQFAGPMPFTFSEEAAGKFVVIEGRRQDWVPRPVVVRNWRVGMFDEPPFRDTEPLLANGFAVENVAYRWEKGRIVRPAIQ